MEGRWLRRDGGRTAAPLRGAPSPPAGHSPWGGTGTALPPSTPSSWIRVGHRPRPCTRGAHAGSRWSEATLPTPAWQPELPSGGRAQWPELARGGSTLPQGPTRDGAQGHGAAPAPPSPRSCGAKMRPQHPGTAAGGPGCPAPARGRSGGVGGAAPGAPQQGREADGHPTPCVSGAGVGVAGAQRVTLLSQPDSGFVTGLSPRGRGRGCRGAHG